MKRREKEQLVDVSADGANGEKHFKKSNKGMTALTAAVIIAVVILNAVELQIAGNVKGGILQGAFVK